MNAGYGSDIDVTPTYPAGYNMANMMTVVATDQSNQVEHYTHHC